MSGLGGGGGILGAGGAANGSGGGAGSASASGRVAKAGSDTVSTGRGVLGGGQATGSSTARCRAMLVANASPSRTPGEPERDAITTMIGECYRSAGKLRTMKRLLFALLFHLLFALPPSAARAELPDPMRFSVVLELGNVAQAKKWLDEGLDPNFEGHLIGTGLMIGAWEGNIPLMELFLERGADLHQTNRFGETALMLAAWKNRKEAMHWLLERGARPNRGNGEAREWTALHYATFAGHAALVEDLLAAGADVNARSTNGSTVVMMAAREGHAALAARLLEAGANPALKNDYDDDAVAWAMRQGNYAIAKSFTDAANFAELARQAAAAPPPPPQRSLPVPDAVDELLRKARLAEMEGKRDEAIKNYQQAWEKLKKRQAPQKVGAGKAAKKPAAKPPGNPKALVIRAKRGQPEKQSLSVTYDGAAAGSKDAPDVDQLLEQARAAEATGRRQEALRLYREASARLRASQP